MGGIQVMNRNSNAFLKEEYNDLVLKKLEWKLRILEIRIGHSFFS